MKGEIADMMEAQAGGKGRAGGSGFTRDELRELFSLVSNTTCNTRDLLCNSSSEEWRVGCPHAV